MDEKGKIDILIVDDTPQNIISIEAILLNEKYNIVKANSGIEALSLMLDYDFAVVLLDVQMPEMNGFEVAEYMKKSEKTKYIPIIFITAINKEEQYINRGYKCGAVDYLFKPLDPYILESKVRVFTELHEQKKLIKSYSLTVENKNEELKKSQEANELKNQFLANMSHELRTPLNAIIGISKMILKYKNENLDEQQKEGISAINFSGERLLVLINDILDISKIESGKMDIHKSIFDLRVFLKEYNNIMKNLIEDKSIIFDIEIDDDNLKFIETDPQKLGQVIMNLLSNAVKFTEKGSITLKIRTENKKIWFNIIDTGIGIEEANISKLFEKFYQIDNNLSKKYKGTGLGLALSKSLLNLLGGDIFVESSPGNGSNFYFYLPYDEIAYKNEIVEVVKKELVQKNNYARKRKIMVVDDEELGRITANYFLSGMFDCIFAENGYEAIELIIKENPDLVLMDIMMPEMDGFETLENIKGLGINIPIIALTGLGMGDEKEKILEAGFNGYILKPISEEELHSEINKFL